MRPVTDASGKERICWLLIDKYLRKARPDMADKVTLGSVESILGLEMDIHIMTGKEREVG